MISLRAEWLDYAWDVIADDGTVAAHRGECMRLGGAFCGEMCHPHDASLRYPGYMGAHYERDRVMFVGAVHNGNALFSEDFRRVEAATAAWRGAGRSVAADETYLSEVRQGYEIVMPGWGPWRNGFGRVLDALKIGVKSVVYTNIAKCWSSPRKPPVVAKIGTQDESLMEFCSTESAYDIARLVELLTPSQIYVSARNAYVAAQQWSRWVLPTERVWVFNANTGALLRGNTDEATLAEASAQYESLHRRTDADNKTTGDV